MNYEQMNNNKAYIAGTIESEPKLSHEVMGENFYEVNLKVKRLSGYCDIIPLTISEKIMQESNLAVGTDIACNGQFRSYNKQDSLKSKLMLTVFVREFVPYSEHVNPNMLEITGYVCKEPIYRTTPFKREICDVLLAVNRSYNKSDYLPCIAWGRNAKFVKDWTVGEKVKLFGRIQSRSYQKRLNEQECVQKVAYEISINKIEKVMQDEQEIKPEGMELNYYANAK